MVHLAQRERVLPALYDALAVRHGAVVAKAIRGMCAVEREVNRRRNVAIGQALTELGQAAADRGFAFAALKGAAWVVEDAGGAAPWRGMIDIDVLVDPSRFDDVPLLLGRLGYARLSDSARFRTNFHHAPFARPDSPAMIEVHRHLGWQHRLLAPGIVFEGARPVAKGLLLPSPWCRALHAVIHWQIQDFGLSRATVPLSAVVEVDRFLVRTDVDWAALAAHARAVGAIDACQAAFALTSALIGSLPPTEFPSTSFGGRHVMRALLRKRSPWRTWIAREKWRAGTLWRCEKLAYRWAVRGARPATVHAAVLAGRLVRLPHLIVRGCGIVLRAFALVLSERSRRKYLAR